MSLSLSWLPSPAAGDVESALGRLIESWLAGWIVRSPALRVQARNRGEIKTLHWQGVPGAMLGCSDDAEALVGRDACGGAGDVAQPGDLEILHGVGSKLLGELASYLSRLGDVVADERPPSRRSLPDGELFTVTPSTGGWSLGLALAPTTLIAARKAVAVTSRRPTLGTRRGALATEVARLGCHLGHARLSAGEVAMLEVGDVIALDRQLVAPLSLTVESHVCASGKAKIVRSAQGASIAIAERTSLLRKVG